MTQTQARVAQFLHRLASLRASRRQSRASGKHAFNVGDSLCNARLVPVVARPRLKAKYASACWLVASWVNPIAHKPSNSSRVNRHAIQKAQEVRLAP